MGVFSNGDPRVQWDQREAGYDRAEAELAIAKRAAESLKHRPSIELASARLEEVQATRAQYRAQRARLDEASAALEKAERELHSAMQIESFGTLDAKEAVKQRDAVIVLQAKVRRLDHDVRDLAASTNGARERLAQITFGGAEAVVIPQTRELVAKVFDYKRIEAVFADAQELGRKANAAQAAWWMVAEEIAREAFAERMKAETKGAGPVMPKDQRREERKLPTLADLEQCFARRREGFEAERRRLEGQLAQMRGELAALGGAL